MDMSDGHQKMLIVLVTFSKWAKRATCAMGSVILALGCVGEVIKSAYKIEKAASETRKS